MTEINLVLFGHIHYPINWDHVTKFTSKIFKIGSFNQISSISQESDGPWFEYSDQNLLEELNGKLDNDGNKINFLVTKVKLEDNWYIRILNPNTVVISLFETADILKSENIKIENFILKALIKASLIQNIYRNLSSDVYLIAHEETRGCLFDMNYNKYDIIHNTNQASLCSKCSAEIDTKNLPNGFKSDVEKELQRLKKDLFYKISDFVKAHPILSIIIGGAFGITINVASSYIYQLFINFGWSLSGGDSPSCSEIRNLSLSALSN